MSTATHYDASYYRWYQSIGEFGAHFKLRDFAPHIQPTDRVIDFGCGGGHQLALLTAAEKIGVEISAVARAEAAKLGIATVECSEQLPAEWADVVISHGALEHVDHPLLELQRLLRAMKPGATIVCQFPHELRAPWRAGDINQHLYTWSPLCAGNLFTRAGFDVASVTTYAVCWPPRYQLVHRILGDALFYRFSQLYARTLYPIAARLTGRIYLRYIRVIARKATKLARLIK